MSASPEDRDFRDFQMAFAARIRDPRGHPRPQGVPARRMRVYEELLFSNLDSFLLACFPVTVKLLGVRSWRSTVRRYFAEHRCRSPLFRDIPGEFLRWMEPVAATLYPDRPWLYEFMHYEWLELDVSMDPATGDGDIDPQGDLLAGHPVLNPTARLACYHYPVHRIGPRFKPPPADGVLHCYLLYRDHEDVVRFTLLNAVTARLLEVLHDEALTGDEALRRIAGELNHEDTHTLIEFGREVLEGLRDAGAVHGIQRMA
jgi:uncharacterized protein